MTVWKFDRRMPRRRRNVSIAAVEASGQPAHLLVQRLRAVDADGHHQAADAARQRPLDERHGLVAEPAGRREIQQEERPAVLLDGGDEIVEIPAHEQLAAGQMHPAELRPAIEEEADLVGRHLVDALLLPDVAHLAAEVAVVGRDERHLIGQGRRTQVGAEDRAGEAELSVDHRECESIVTDPSGPVNALITWTLTRSRRAGYTRNRTPRTVSHPNPCSTRMSPLSSRPRMKKG